MAFRVDQGCLIPVLVVVEVRDARERILYSDAPVRGVEVEVSDMALGVLLPGQVSYRIIPRTCLAVKRIDDLALPVDGIERGVSRKCRLSRMAQSTKTTAQELSASHPTPPCLQGNPASKQAQGLKLVPFPSVPFILSPLSQQERDDLEEEDASARQQRQETDAPEHALN